MPAQICFSRAVSDSTLKTNSKTNIVNNKIRGIENLHILLWICKDTCWVQEYRWVGVGLIAPTLCVAIYLTKKCFHQRDEFIHNLAVCFWVSANSIWMIGEFFFDDHTRNIAIVFFGLGLLTLATHYLPKWFGMLNRSLRQAQT